MTKKEKADVLALREEGRTLRQIAEELGIPFNTVKSFVYRHKGHTPAGGSPAAGRAVPAVPPASERVSRPCLCCGKPVEQDPHRKEKKFCGAGCRVRWWNRNAAQSGGKSLHAKRCAYCGRTFRAYGSRKYCSHPCYISARFGKERGA